MWYNIWHRGVRTTTRLWTLKRPRKWLCTSAGQDCNSSFLTLEPVHDKILKWLTCEVTEMCWGKNKKLPVECAVHLLMVITRPTEESQGLLSSVHLLLTLSPPHDPICQEQTPTFSLCSSSPPASSSLRESLSLSIHHCIFCPGTTLRRLYKFSASLSCKVAIRLLSLLLKTLTKET